MFFFQGGGVFPSEQYQIAPREDRALGTMQYCYGGRPPHPWAQHGIVPKVGRVSSSPLGITLSVLFSVGEGAQELNIVPREGGSSLGAI